jgi:predicted GNAT family acetyltransferase
MAETAHVTVEENAENGRYEALTDAGIVAGFAEYHDRADVRVFTHTEVDHAFDGQGVGSRLARGACDHVREHGLRLTATCPFLGAYLDRHPEYADLRA